MQIKTKKLKKEAKEKIENERMDAIYALTKFELAKDILKGNIIYVDSKGNKIIRLMEKHFDRAKRHLLALSVYK